MRTLGRLKCEGIDRNGGRTRKVASGIAVEVMKEIGRREKRCCDLKKDKMTHAGLPRNNVNY